MKDVGRLALAGLVHDLPALFSKFGVTLSERPQQILALAQLSDPSLSAILSQAESVLTGTDQTQPLALGRPLISIFSRVSLHSPDALPPTYYTLAPLPPTDGKSEAFDPLFPVSSEPQLSYPSYLRAFVKELDRISFDVDKDSFACLYQHLLALLQQYAWCIPSHSNDVSLFDHLRLSSAIAVCLYIWGEDPGGSEEFSLVVGDLSGIQKYIFDIAAVGAGGVARRLRARSFYVSALSDVIGYQAAVLFGVPSGNVIMSSGGKFYVLVPHITGLEERLEVFRREIDSWFYTQFNGEIALNLANTCFSSAEFKASHTGEPGFGGVLASLGKQLSREKQRRFTPVLQQDGLWNEDAFLIRPDFWGEIICSSCHKFPARHEEDICDLCERDRTIGKLLPSIRYLAFYQQAQEGQNVLPMPKGWSVRILDKNQLAEASGAYLIVKLNNPSIDELAGFPATFRYLANQIPVDSHRSPLSFEEIAKKGGQPELLGYVKADVDRLGTIFAQGLRRDEGGYDTAPHIAALSREMDLFFSGWMQHQLSQNSDYSSFYTIFSGGDDLFLVGPWDKAAELAQEINRKFHAFTANNPEITLSAGILFTKDRYPIARAAADAEEVLETSKEKEWEDEQGTRHNRDQITLLGDTLKWRAAEAAFAEIKSLKRYQGKMKSAFLYSLIEYGRLYRLWIHEKSVTGLRYKPMFAYNIARNLKRDNPELYQWADEILQSLHSKSSNSKMEHIGLVAQYLLFYQRAKEEQQQ